MKKIVAVLAAFLFLTGILACHKSGGGGTNGATSASGANLVSISVTPGNQSIAKGTSVQFKATGTYSDDTTQDLSSQATWTSSDIAKATVSSSGLAVGSAAGTATITASMGAVSGSTPLSVTGALLVSIAISPMNPVIPGGLIQQFTAIGTYSDNTTQDITAQVTWSSSNNSVATITIAGSAAGLAAGTTTISAALGNTTASSTLTVTSATLVSIAVTPTNVTIATGLAQQFTAIGTYSDNTTYDLTASVTWNSSNTSVATISNAAGSNGLASSSSMGAATITATDPATNINGSTTLTVTSATLVSIAVTATNGMIAKGLTQQFIAIGTFSDSSTYDVTASITWTSSNAAVATISNAAGSKGLATSTAAGSTIIKASDPATAINGSRTLTVTAATLVSLNVTATNTTIAKGLTQQFTAIGTYSDKTTNDVTKSVTWSSSNTAVASISNVAGSKGLAISTGPGSAVITAIDPATSVNASTTLAVTSAVLVSIEVTPASDSSSLGLTKQFSAIGTYSDNTTHDLTTSVTWTSSEATVAAISNAAGSKGLASSIGIGSTTISATDPATNVIGSATLTVTSATLVSITVTATNSLIAKGLTQQFTATGTYSDNSTNDLTSSVTWNSSNASVAAISNAAGSKGLATAIVAGSTTIRATDPATNISGSMTLTVTSATLVSIAVTPTSATTKQGLTKQFTATGTYSDNSTNNLTPSVTWNSSDAAVATISNAAGSNGLATATGAGSTSITATDPTTNISNSTTFFVTQVQLVSISVTPTNPNIPSNVSKGFIATGVFSDNTTLNISGQVTWSSSNTAIANITKSGKATPVSPGTTTITATLGSKSGSTTLEVTTATLVSVAVTPTSPGIPKSLTKAFIATGTFSDNTTQDISALVAWSSSNRSVATISSPGLATSVTPGTTTIKAVLGSFNDSTTLTITPATLVSIAVTPANPGIPISVTQGFTATGTYSDGTTQNLTGLVTWSSSNTSVATMTAGKATPVSPGTTTIQATLGGITGSTTLTVNASTLVSIAVTPTNPSIPSGLTKVFTATGSYSDGATQDITTQVTWGSLNTAVATISNATPKGQATLLSAGTTTVTATDPTTNLSGSTTLTVTAATLVSITVMPATTTIANGGTKSFTATGNYSDGTTQNITALVTWGSSNTAVAAISNAGSKGLATWVGAGTANITASVPMTAITASATLTASP